jgi:hypothetical protein
MSDAVHKITDPADPNRCQGIFAKGQCYNLATPGFKYCRVHGGGQESHQQAAKLKNYRIFKYEQRLAELGNNDEIKSLRDEIAVMRLLVEERINMIDGDILLHSGPLSDLVMKVTAVVGQCNKIEGTLSKSVDRAAILTFAGEIIKIISEEVSKLGLAPAVESQCLETIGVKIVQQIGKE